MTSMTKNADQKRTAAYSRASVRTKVEETVGGDSIDYVLEDGGTVFHIPHPFFYDAATKAALEEIEDNAKDRDALTAKILLGDEQFAKFEAEGGDPAEIGLLQIAVSQDTREALTNGRPTTR